MIKCTNLQGEIMKKENGPKGARVAAGSPWRRVCTGLGTEWLEPGLEAGSSEVQRTGGLEPI